MEVNKVTNSPSLVVIAHDRDRSLKRLLHSLSQSNYLHSNIQLIISIDKNSNPEVYRIAEEFIWQYGTKELIKHKQNLGLKKHVLACAQLSKKYGSVILLEDDITVARHYYDYAIQASKFYNSEERIAGISLYSYAISESCFLPFYPYDDGYDNYFMQVPSSWGQIIRSEDWRRFESWKQSSSRKKSVALPQYAEQWGENSWKKEYLQFMLDTDLYFAFPRESQSSNFEDRGTHSSSERLFQVALQHHQKTYQFNNYEESLSRYDSSFEIEPETLKKLNPAFKPYDFSVDLYGSKDPKQLKPLVLSCKKSKSPILSFGSQLFPPIQNLIENTNGEDFHLSETKTWMDEESDQEKFYPPGLIPNGKVISAPSLEVNLVIPLLDWHEEKLIKLIQSIENQEYQNWKCLLVAKKNELEKVESLLRQKQCSKKVSLVASLDEDLISMLERGFNEQSGDILCYFSPNQKLKPLHLSSACKAFNHIHAVKWLKVFHSKESITQFRWNPEIIANRIFRLRKKTSMEGMFISRHIWVSLDAGFNQKAKGWEEEEWILRAIKKFHFYPLIQDNIIDPQPRSTRQISHKVLIDNRNKTSHFKRLAISLLQYLYSRNIPYLRSFLPLYFNLNDLIRLDEEHRSYYLDRY